MRPGKVATIGAAVAFLAVAIVAVAYRGAPRPALPVYGELPAFAFTDQRGQPFGDRELRDHVTVASFLFTRCPTICPVVTLKLKKFEEQTRDLPNLRLVSFSVDPEYDTPAQLAAFARRMHASTERWSFVTGPSAAMRAQVEGAFKIAMDRRGTLANGTPDIVHGSHFVLIDRDLRIRGYYDSDDANHLQELADDARALAETSN
jgi:protein SCO1/2